MNLLDRLRQALGESLARDVEVGIGAVGIGVFTADGRQVGATVRETGTTTLDISDGGETWSDLWIEGYVGTTPTRSVQDKLETICHSYGVAWDKNTRSIVCPAEPSAFPDVARRIAAASIAIDGWRLWLTERDTDTEHVNNIVRDVGSIAGRREWEMQEYAAIRGQKYTGWTARALLTRKGRQAALAFLDDNTHDRAMQRAMGWMLDTDVPLIFVARPNVANDMKNAREFVGRAAIVARSRTGTAEAIVDAAERTAEAA
jgi:hypothetical protein